MSFVKVLVYFMIYSLLGVIYDGLAIYKGRKMVVPRDIDVFDAIV